MKNSFKVLALSLSFIPIVLLLSAFNLPGSEPAFRFPYKQAGLTERQAAVHLLNRFAFGPAKGDVDRVVNQGLERWFAGQLEASLRDGGLDEKLKHYPSLTMSNALIVQKYPPIGRVRREALSEGALNKDSLSKDRRALEAFMASKGYLPQSALLSELSSQKLYRAAFSANQLKEVLTDFWFNHFNVSVSKGSVKPFVTVYERESIRPYVLGRFEDLLVATAQSPAMLTYLDNAGSSAANAQALQRGSKKGGRGNKAGKTSLRGLNENYAREVMELHTLGVDGGYTQNDVTQAARVLTGWTINPQVYKPGRRPDAYTRPGFVQQGDFLFNPDRHDRGEKEVLGLRFESGGTFDEGLKLLHHLAVHPSTAQFICKKLAVRFISDEPPARIVDKMAATFLKTKGNIAEVLRTMACSDEFWSGEALYAKTRSPFELAISSVRGLDASIHDAEALNAWIAKMGQKLYQYAEPTGFPDKGAYWINTGALLNRMNFGLALASGQVAGVEADLLALNNNHEPESPEAALNTYTRLLLPERNVQSVGKRLYPLLKEPQLQKKVDSAASKVPAAKPAGAQSEEPEEVGPKQRKNAKGASTQSKKNNTQLAQAVGILLGSPEFQRR